MNPRASMILFAAIAWVVSSLFVWFWVGLGISTRTGEAPSFSQVLSALEGMDGARYAQIARSGYSDTDPSHADTAFFPLFPLVGWFLSQITGLPIGISLVLLSWVFGVISLILFGLYLQRYARDFPGIQTLGVVLLSIWPTSFFLRMPYTESLYLLLSLLVFQRMQREKGSLLGGTLCGLATATRSVGVALSATWFVDYWLREKSIPKRMIALLISISGLLAYGFFLYCQFGSPFLCIQSQDQWGFRASPGWSREGISLLTGEPIWSVYNPESEVYWGSVDRHAPWWRSLQFANPIWLLIAVTLVFIGFVFNSLDSRESLLGMLLLLIPYVTHSYRSGMAAHGRYALIVFPALIVLSKALTRVPVYFRIPVLMSLSAGLACYSYQLGTGGLIL